MIKSSVQVQRVTTQSPRDCFAQLAEIHRSEIEDGFLSSLGSRFLGKVYRGVASCPQAFILAAMRGNTIAGFICGSTDTRKVYRSFLVSQGASATMHLIPHIVSISTLRKVGETLLYPARNHEIESPRPEILNFCVSREFQRQGVGGRLFGELVAEFRRRDVRSFRILTGLEQSKALRFYESVGAVRESETNVHGDRKSLVFTYAVPVAASTPRAA